MLKWVAALAAAVALSACATANFSAKGEGPVLSGSQVYIYSFIDVRNNDLGPRMIAQVNEQLRARLAEYGVDSRLITFRETSYGRYTSVTGSVAVPVPQIVEQNARAEQEFGADYRLVIMPTQITIYDAAQNYQITWDIFDVSTGEIAWSSSMRGNRTVWYSADEDAEGRAATIVDGLINQMVASNMLRAPPPASAAPAS